MDEEKEVKQTLVCIYGHKGILHHKPNDMVDMLHNGTYVAENNKNELEKYKEI